MKTSRLHLHTVLFFLIVVIFSSCSKKLRFATSSVVPAAEGSVKYSKDKNNNYSIKVDIRNLADPKKLTPPENTYVLWMQTESNGVKNIGQIVSSSGWFSSALKASLSATTPFKPTGFFITAEDNGNISYPGNSVVLRTR